ncbi:hypothetical protein [Sneathiella litorea]|uniref:Uncharacterized protein n=1 Tax=Sneathiella litorea TaxID=2606216 RepID=A0A6L8WAN1_9PROT|nr:hypothetical protein [Sneathiella litorea]MZR32101.1 hypothetical protein [Sneathiella litorea]
MAIDPLILLPASALAVLFVILFIRLVAGPREAYLTPERLAAFLSDQEPDDKIVSSVISGDKRYALVHWQNGKGIGLVRSFGNKLVLQMLGREMLEKCTWRDNATVLYIPRQGFAFPAVKFACDPSDLGTLEQYLDGENNAAT